MKDTPWGEIQERMVAKERLANLIADAEAEGLVVIDPLEFPFIAAAAKSIIKELRSES